MKDFIPENILVYIAVDNSQRGKGFGKQLMQKAISISEEILRFMWNQITLLKYYMKN
jgi:ribosomal protein S18 acetylase RimI-like enzyme